jgi:DNA-binding GntR family transcriptional regulator
MGPLYQRLEHHYDTPGLWTAAMAEHRVVLKAIAEHDVPGARLAMQRHLNKAYKRFNKGWSTPH